MASAETRKLLAEAQAMTAKGRLRRAVDIYREMEALEPDDGAWPHRSGELLQKLGEPGEAQAALDRAVEAYARAGFVLKAVAVCKLILRAWPGADEARRRLEELNAERGIVVQPPPPPPPPPLEPPTFNASGSVDIEIDVPTEDPATTSREISLEIEITAEPLLAPPARAALRSSALALALGADGPGRLIDQSNLVELSPGQVLFRQGDPGDDLYVVVAGEVRVFAEGPPRTQVGRLGEGSFFGEIALVTEASRSATVEAGEEPTQLLSFSRRVVSELCAAHPSFLSVILAAVRERLVALLAATSPLFEPFGGAEKQSLIGRFRCRDVNAGAVLVSQGKRADGLYALLSGHAEVVRHEGGAERVLSPLAPGDLFGEMSLLTGQPAVATVRAVSRVLVLHLSAADFHDVIMTHPHVLIVVGELAEQRRSKLDELEKSGSFAEGHVDLL